MYIVNERNNNKNIRNKPFLKWVGGKSQMLEVIHEHLPDKFNKYVEPFVGGGAVYFSLNHSNSTISDINDELINSYIMVRDNVHSLIEILNTYINNEEFYYEMRAKDISGLSALERAARMIFLNKTCYNGLYRVNQKGQFNTPFGKYKNPKICDVETLISASIHLQDTIILSQSYEKTLECETKPGDFIFLDPPYVPISEYSDFTRYTKDKFFEVDQKSLAEQVKRLHSNGCYVLLTNSDHELVHDLYKDYEIKTYDTKRHINCKGDNRVGKDVLVIAKPTKFYPSVLDRREQLSNFPGTRYMGSKAKLIEDIWSITKDLQFNSVLDMFSGSGIVSYMFKSAGKEVISNDYMQFSAYLTKAVIENDHVLLSKNDVEDLLIAKPDFDYFVSEKFKGIYFTDNDNRTIDIIRNNIFKMENQFKKALAISSLTRSCIKRRPRGIFAYTGFKYDDGRKDLQMSIEEHFLKAVDELNSSIFQNGTKCISTNVDYKECTANVDLIYLDPPYFSLKSDNEYVRRYHFVEGLARNWEGVEIQEHTKTKKFKSYPSDFSTYSGAKDAFESIFSKYKKSIIVVSYSSNSLPTKDEIIELLKKYKNDVTLHEIDYQYSFANQRSKVNDNANRVKEYIFIGK